MKRRFKTTLTVLGFALLLPLSSPATTIQTIISIPMVEDAALAYDAGSVCVVFDNVLTGSEASQATVPSFGQVVGLVAAKSTGGWLQFHESAGGHTLARHVGKTDAELLARIQSSPKISGASTFLDQATAERVISESIGADRATLNAWLRNAKAGERLRLTYSGSQTVGRGVMQGQTVVNDLSGARVILESQGGGKYHILTAFPE